MSSDNPLTEPGIAHPDIDEALIARLVRTFYERARADDVIGPIFAEAVHDWDEHIANITAFWVVGDLAQRPLQWPPDAAASDAAARERTFRPLAALFEATAKELCSPGAANTFIIRARRIADSFEMAIGTQRGEIRRPRHSRM